LSRSVTTEQQKKKINLKIFVVILLLIVCKTPENVRQTIPETVQKLFPRE
jgi:hypothetical protein